RVVSAADRVEVVEDVLPVRFGRHGTLRLAVGPHPTRAVRPWGGCGGPAASSAVGRRPMEGGTPRARAPDGWPPCRRPAVRGGPPGGGPRLTVTARLLLILAGVAACSTAFALVVQERSLSRDLERAARERLDRAAGAAERLVEGHLAALGERYRAISGTPQLR